MFIQTWMWFGNTAIMLMSGIMGINPSLFEAANIDGATLIPGLHLFKNLQSLSVLQEAGTINFDAIRGYGNSAIISFSATLLSHC